MTGQGGTLEPRARRQLHERFLLPLSVLILSSCTVTLISRYDEVTDKACTELHQKVTGFLLKMESAASPEIPYKLNVSFYQDTKLTLESILLRAESIDKNEKTVEQVKLLQGSIENLRKIHEESDLLKPIVIQASRTAINAQFKSILTLELAKKRGE